MAEAIALGWPQSAATIPPRPDLAADAQRALKTDALEQHICEVMAGDNPPARAQRDRLARLLFDPDATLRGGDGDGAAA